MKLSSLRESLSTGAIAARPMALKVKRTKRQAQNAVPISDDYMGTSTAKHPKNTMDTVWQPLKSKKVTHWYNKYAQEANQDERLLPQFRGKGY